MSGMKGDGVSVAWLEEEHVTPIEACSLGEFL